METHQVVQLVIALVQAIVTVGLLIFAGGRRWGSSREQLHGVTTRVEAIEQDARAAAQKAVDLESWRHEMNADHVNVQTALETANREMSKLTSHVQGLHYQIKEWVEQRFIAREVVAQQHRDVERRLDALEARVNRLRNGS